MQHRAVAVILAAVVLAGTAPATQFVSVAAGNWSAPATWGAATVEAGAGFAAVGIGDTLAAVTAADSSRPYSLAVLPGVAIGAEPFLSPAGTVVAERGRWLTDNGKVLDWHRPSGLRSTVP